MNSSLSVEIFSLRSADVVKGVLEGTYDLGVCLSPQSHPELDITTLAKDSLEIVVRKNHPLMKELIVDRFHRVQEYSAIMPKAFEGIEVCETHPVLDKFKIKPAIQMVFDSYCVAAEILAESDCWSLFPSLFISFYKGRLVPLGKAKNWSATYTISAVTRRKSYRSKAETRLIDDLGSRLRARI